VHKSSCAFPLPCWNHSARFGTVPGSILSPGIARDWQEWPADKGAPFFTLSGTMVRKLVKDDNSQFLHWNILNEAGRDVASGLYIAHIEMPKLGVTKILKLVVIHD